MKKYKTTIIITTLITLLPIVIGLFLWNKLPDTLATHWGSVTAPSRFRSTKSVNSAPDPNVPEATVTGLFHSTPAIVTFVFIRFPPPLTKIPDRLYRFFCYAHYCDDLFLSSCIHMQDMLRYRMPCALPAKYSIRSRFPPHSF